MQARAIYYTAEALAARGRDDIPEDMLSRKHLVYSSPATLAFNSPGAEGFGVKRAGLSVPDSVMLIVSPGCCGRNTSSISALPRYENRFFYLTMDETDLVTGRHLRKIPEAVQAICASLKKQPSVVMVCTTCVDALLGTDMERICRKAEELTGTRVRPCYMYALTREGTRPPMVQVRQSIYSLLEKKKRRARSVNLIGYFAQITPESELFALLQAAGIDKVRQIGACPDYDDFMEMAEANVNIVLHQEARPAAQDMEKRLGIPWLELARVYQIDKVQHQYAALGRVFGVHFDDEAYKAEAEAAVTACRAAHPDTVFAVGETANVNPFELALALVRYGFRVAEVFGTLSKEQYVYVDKLAKLSPETRIYMNLSPSMMHYTPEGSGVQMTIGRDAAYYHPECPTVHWAEDVQPFGYQGIRELFTRISAALAGHAVQAGGSIWLASEQQGSEKTAQRSEPVIGGISCGVDSPMDAPKGLRLHLTPFAPDQSGAEEVLFEMDGISVILDAGGCTGNICGFDEPRWFTRKSAVMSAAMRDMDAVLGQDKRLQRAVGEVCDTSEPAFCALIGTPVPAVIAMDYPALAGVIAKRTDIPMLSIDTNGMTLYDVGVSKAYQALFTAFAKEAAVEDGRLGVLGAVPLDIGGQEEADRLKRVLQESGWKRPVIYGYGDGLDQVRQAGRAAANLVISYAGLRAARALRERFGTPYRIDDPLARAMTFAREDIAGKKVLVVHQQVRAQVLGEVLEQLGAETVTRATWFGTDPEIGTCIWLREEKEFTALAMDGYDVIVADEALRALIPAYRGTFYRMPHFAVSGKLR